MQNHTVALTAADKDAAYYGVLFESETRHSMTGAGLHNRSFDHIVQVWENRPSKANGADPSVLVTPHGRPTTETHTFCMKAIATVIAAHPLGDDKPRGVQIAVGDTVTLTIAGLPIGTFAVKAGMLSDPSLERIA